MRFVAPHRKTLARLRVVYQDGLAVIGAFKVMADEEQLPAFAVMHTPGDYASNEPIDVTAKESPALRNKS